MGKCFEKEKGGKVVRDVMFGLFWFLGFDQVYKLGSRDSQK